MGRYTYCFIVLCYSFLAMTLSFTVSPRVRGTWRSDKTFIGFDYESQCWIDTSPTCERDLSCRLGSASNPLTWIPRGSELPATFDPCDSDLDFEAAI